MQFSQMPHGWVVGPPLPSGPVQLRALAISRAVVVLPTPRMPGQNISVVKAVVVDGVGQGLHQRILPQQIFKILRAVFAGENHILFLFFFFCHR